MSTQRPGKPGDELNEIDRESRESTRLPARLYHPDMLDLIEAIANMNETKEKDRARLLKIVAQQRAYIQKNGYDPNKVCNPVRTNMEAYRRDMLAPEGIAKRDTLIFKVLEAEELAWASTMPPSSPVQQNAQVKEKLDAVSGATKRSIRDIQRFIAKYGEPQLNIPTKVGDQYLVRYPISRLQIGSVLTITDVRLTSRFMVYAFDENGEEYTFDYELLSEIAEIADPNTAN